MFTDSHYLLNAQYLGSITTVTIDPFCPVASIGNPSYETPYQAGCSGHDFVIMLSGPKSCCNGRDHQFKRCKYSSFN